MDKRIKYSRYNAISRLFAGEGNRLRSTYHAFISYKHVSSASFARNLERELKRYAKPLWSRPLRIFRDENYIVPGKPLSEIITAALDRSNHLIYLASPDAANSAWVRDELLEWTGSPERRENLIIVLTAGEIVYDSQTKLIDWVRTDVFPRALKGRLGKVPFFVDARSFVEPSIQKSGNAEFKRALNQIVAKLRNIDPVELSGKEERQHRRNVMIGVGLASVLLLSLFVATVTWRGQQEQAILASANGDLAAAQAILRSDAPDLRAATKLALNVLRNAPSPSARDVLQEIAQQLPQQLWWVDVPRSPELSTSSQVLAFTNDGDLVVRRSDAEGVVLSADTGTEMGRISYPPLNVLMRRVSADDWIPQFDRTTDRVAVKAEDEALIVNLSTGKVDGNFQPLQPPNLPFAYNWKTGDFVWVDSNSRLRAAKWPNLEVTKVLPLVKEGAASASGGEVAVSDDGGLFAAGFSLREDEAAFTSDESFVVVESKTMRAVRTIQSTGGQIAFLAFEPGPNPRRIAVAHRTGPVQIYDVYSERAPLILEGSVNPDRLVWSTDRKFIALVDNFSETSGSNINETRFGRRIISIPQTRTQSFDDARFSADGNRLYVSGRIELRASYSNFVGAYDLTASDSLFSVRLVSKQATGAVDAVAFNPDATIMIVSEPDQTGDTNRLFAVDARSGSILQHLEHPPEVEAYTSGIAFTDDGQHLIETEFGTFFYAWTKGFDLVGYGKKEPPSVPAARTEFEGPTLIDETEFARATVLRLEAQQRSLSNSPRASTEDGRFHASSTNEDGWFIGEESGACQISLTGAENADEILAVRLSSGQACQQVNALALIPDGSVLAIGVLGNVGDKNSASGQELQIWAKRTAFGRITCQIVGCQPWRRLNVVSLQGQVHTITFSKTGRWLGLRDGSGAISLLDGKTFNLNQVLLSQPGNSTPSPPSITFSPDEKWLATPLAQNGGPARWRLADSDLVDSVGSRILDR